jgi:hypothetical protein
MIGEYLVQQVSESLYSEALCRVPSDTLRALEAASLEDQARERLHEIMARLAARRAAVRAAPLGED